MKLRTIVLTITVLTAAGMWAPQVLAEAYAAADTSARQESKWTKAFSRLTVGGYGEAVGTYNFYSDNVFRYQFPDSYRDSKGHARFDLPHVVIMLGYDFGKGWTLGTEIEFEHGGVEAAVEMENEEAGEFEREIERGGEVALEQFWIQKEFMPELNLRMGHIVVPVGATNNKHLPTEFFTAYRPEGENTIIPCTWHETGISLWGRAGDWRYEVQLLPGLNSVFFSNSEWVHGGSASPYEFKPANHLAGAFRVDNYSVKGLRMSLSGYIGNSFNNDIVTEERSRYAGVKGTVMIGAFDFEYQGHGLVVRGNYDYGYLKDAQLIGAWNSSSMNSTESPYKHTLVGQAAMAGGVEAGYDIFSAVNKLSGKQKFYVFGRYEYYDSYIPAPATTDYPWTDKHRIAMGINYYPIDEIVIKAEYSHRFLKSQYIDEPSVSIGIAYAGFFK